MVNPKSWFGSGNTKEKLKIDREVILITKGLNGPVMTLSANLKEQLQKPWANALILKNMGRAHTLNFMIAKLL